MGRHKDTNWIIPDNVVDWNQAQIAVLMDIRDELKHLNRTLDCRMFQSIPNTLLGIEDNTRKPIQKSRPTKLAAKRNGAPKK